MNYIFDKEFAKQHYLKYYKLVQYLSGTLWIICFFYIAILLSLRLLWDVIINKFFGDLALFSILYLVLFGLLIFITTAMFNTRFLNRYNHTKLNIFFQKNGIHFVNDTEGDFYWLSGYAVSREHHRDFIKKVTALKITTQYIIVYGDIEQQYSYKTYRGKKVKIKRCYDNENDLIRRIKEYM